MLGESVVYSLVSATKVSHIFKTCSCDARNF